ncbi:MAG: aminotransferase class III-fold pyridoxal phosphate-dependent enzyme, partial [Candidatus Omnitrophica bacterium]|nr:aminotransferase class III-fold pyridoxal phosphate-dependent enzyme [Candidatus Omnitrophota bacterium]
AAILVEPIAANMGVVLPNPDFLPGLRQLCDDYGSLLIFDEVVTGFRITHGGVQDYYGIKPDLTCLGKIIGGGLPIGAFGGKREVMKFLAPEGGVYQAGTFSGNPISMIAGLATLDQLGRIHPYPQLETMAQKLYLGIQEAAHECKLQIRIHTIGSMFSLFFTDKQIVNYDEVRQQDIERFKKFYWGMLRFGVYFAPSPFESNFLSVAHTEDDIRDTLLGVRKVFANIA